MNSVVLESEDERFSTAVLGLRKYRWKMFDVS
jgi:hypothetical protein